MAIRSSHRTHSQRPDCLKHPVVDPTAVVLDAPTSNFNCACMHSNNIQIVSGTLRLGFWCSLHQSFTYPLHRARRGLQFAAHRACKRGCLYHAPNGARLHIYPMGLALYQGSPLIFTASLEIGMNHMRGKTAITRSSQKLLKHTEHTPYILPHTTTHDVCGVNNSRPASLTMPTPSFAHMHGAPAFSACACNSRHSWACHIPNVTSCLLMHCLFTLSFFASPSFSALLHRHEHSCPLLPASLHP
jgi:hypothetical protein